MKRILQNVIWMPFVVLLLNSCSTITPDPIMHKEASYDSSTPKQYDPKNSGIIGFITGDRQKTVGAIITSNFRTKYNNLISSYSWQLYDAEKIKISTDSGIENYQDIYGNELHIIDPQHLVYFLKMNRWNEEGKPDDSVWMRLKSITQ
jgi:hypothetical protein